MSKEIPKTCRVVVIGGGVIGCSVVNILLISN